MRDFQSPGRSAVFADNGMCATSHPLAASVAIDMLKAGGNAVDAALAGGVLLSLCEPHMTGIGGDLFALVHPAPGDAAKGEILGLNGSGRAPKGADAAALRAQGLSEIAPDSAAAITVPGAVDGMCRLSERFGRLGLDAVLAPAIHYAEAGVPVAPRVAADWARVAHKLHGRAGAFLVEGNAPRPGQRFRSPGQAEVLRRIAREGRAAFYEGEVAEDLLAALPAGAPHRLDDFSAQHSEWTVPIFGRYGPWDIVEHPPNGQGAAALLLFDILTHLDLSSVAPLSAARVHLEAEATKLAYDARNRLLADPAHMADPNALQEAGLAADLARRIDPGQAMGPGLGLAGHPHRETVLITVVDRDRMAVSLIWSLFDDFGSGYASPNFGILLHSRGRGFTLTEGHPNAYGPGKRPLHTILPGMVRQDGQLAMAFGVMGGHYQATGHARLITNLVDHGMDLQTAIDAPRSFATDGILRLERGYPDAVRSDLAALGHTVVTPETPIGGAQAAWIDPASGVLIGASDPRKDGIALGY